ncbi:hypothetical protein L249_8063, partial [Ophiocordyceps polyrhachis-furcata BCC 54312]
MTETRRKEADSPALQGYWKSRHSILLIQEAGEITLPDDTYETACE